MLVTDFGRSCAHGRLTFSPDSTLLALVAPSGCVVADAVGGNVLLASSNGGIGECFFWGGPNRRILFVHHSEHGLIPMDADTGTEAAPVAPRFAPPRERSTPRFRAPSAVFAPDGSRAVFRRIDRSQAESGAASRIESLCAVRNVGDRFVPDWACSARERTHHEFFPHTFLTDGERFLYTAQREPARYAVRRSVLVLASARTGEVIAEATVGLHYSVSAVCDGWLALIPEDRPHCHLFRCTAGHLDAEPLEVTSTGGGWCYGAAFHPSGRLFAAVGNDGRVPLLDTGSWTLATEFDWQLGPLQCVAFSPDGALAAAGSERGQVAVWDVDV